MKDETIDLLADIFGVVCGAVPLAFVATVWSQAGFGAASLAFSFFLCAYIFGRWHAGRAFARDMALLHLYYEAKLTKAGESRE